MDIGAGMDISYVLPAGGDDTGGRFEHLACVIGRADRINSVANRHGLDGSVHMRRLKGRLHDGILAGMDLSEDGIAAYCIRIEKKGIVERVMEVKNFSYDRVVKAFDRLLFRLISANMEEFISPYRMELSDVTFEVDEDCRSLLATNRIDHTRPRKAHNLADVIAWGNSHGRHVRGVTEMNLSGEMVAQLLE